MSGSGPGIQPLDLQPDPARAAAVDARMRERLIASLRYIRERAGNHLDFPRPEFDGALDRLHAGSVSSAVFVAYYDLVLAIGREALDDAQQCIDDLVAATKDNPSGVSIVALRDFGNDRVSERYRRFVDTDPNLPFTIMPPAPESVDRCRR